LYRSVPEFTDFVAYQTLFTWIQNTYYFSYQVYHPKSLPYYFLFWTCNFAGEAIELLTIYALFVRTLRVSLSTKKTLRFIPILSTLFFCILAFANFAQSDWQAWTLRNTTKRLEFIQENLIFVQCGLIFAMVLFSFLVAVRWETPAKGILTGFGVDTSVRLTFYTIAIYHPNAMMYWPLGRVLIHAASLAGYLIWFAVVLRTPKSDSPDAIALRENLDSYRLNLENWTKTLGGMVYHLPEDIQANARFVLFKFKTLLIGR